ncbi:hypothetical protein COLO4_15505 [Corchorus olitorius]|uniref:DC1 domain-containing protein n=1 Tax=Corchorus olitorius TaxID=93759 RepID=A0A1R3JMK5_9ROSI|nr:hypothetical protein COLO4_15505 [Corchorus olitorius]
MVKSNCHIHPLSLEDSFVEDDSGEYYCDACEEERHPKDHVYFCKKCLFLGHIECVLSMVKETAATLEELIEEQQSNEENAEMEPVSVNDC